MGTSSVLQVENLHTHFFTREGVLKVVNGVSFSLQAGTVLGLAGESGCGKTTTILSLLRLLPYSGRVIQGSVLFQGKDLLQASEQELRQIRGKEVAICFQDASTALNPRLTVGQQVEEALQSHLPLPKHEAGRMTVAALRAVNLPDPESLLQRYPFQLSGGTCQRVMLAIAIAHKPKVLIADEPTANLDVTLQAEILHLLDRLRQEHGIAILLITHDLGIIARLADQVAIMYAGAIVESADTRTLFQRPLHPYTWSLLQATPHTNPPRKRLHTVRGSPPNPLEIPKECPFLPRCTKATNQCRLNPQPPLQEVEARHLAACFNPVRYEWD